MPWNRYKNGRKAPAFSAGTTDTNRHFAQYLSCAPEKRVKWINYQMPSKEAQVKAMFEIGKAEIAGAITKVPLFWRAIAKAESKEEFWEIWGKENENTIKNFHIVRVLLIGFTSEEEMQYDENVLNDIMKEVCRIPRPTKPYDESWIKNADSAGMSR